MGNVCCNYSTADLPNYQDGRSIGRIQASKEQLSLSAPEEIDPAKVNVIEQLGQSAIDELLKEAQTALANDSVRIAKNRLVNEKFKLFLNEYSFWADFTDLPSGNKLHIYHHQLEYPFTPEMYFLNSLQHTIESFAKVDDSLDQMDLLNFAAVDDLIVTVSRNKTKKILVVEPRIFLLVRVIKRISRDEILEVQKSIQLTPLSEKEPWKTLITRQVNLAEIKLGAVLLKRENGKTTLKSLANVDPLSSTGPMILKTLLKGKFSKFHKNTVKETLKFLGKAGEKEFSNYHWFSNDSAELTRILEENTKIVAANKPDLNDLEKSEIEEVKGLLQETNPGRVTGGGVLEDHKPAGPEDSTRVFIAGLPAQGVKTEEQPASRKQSEAKPASRKQSEAKAEEKPASRKQSEAKAEEVVVSNDQNAVPEPVAQDVEKEQLVSEQTPTQEAHSEKVEELPHKLEHDAPKAPLSQFANDTINQTIEVETPKTLESAKPFEQQQPEEAVKPELPESDANASTNVTESQPPAPESQPETTPEALKEEANEAAPQPEETEEQKPKTGGKKNKKGRKGN